MNEREKSLEPVSSSDVAFESVLDDDADELAHLGYKQVSTPQPGLKINFMPRV